MSQPTPTTHAHDPHATPAHDEGEMVHHLSPWPLVTAVGASVLMLGIVLNPIVVFLGVVGTFVGIAGWVREDMHFYDHPMEELFHHGHAPNPFWGVILFLGTEVMLFGALFTAYFHGRATTATAGMGWEQVELPVFATGINTVVLISSGATMHWAMMSIQKNRRTQFKIGLALTLLLGAAFLAQQVHEYINLVEEHMTLGSSLYGSVFYSLTGTHGLHVLGGLLAILTVFIRALKGQFSKDKYLAVEMAAFYWHFVDVVWVFLFAVIYLRWI